MQNDDVWTAFAEDVRRLEGVMDSYPQSLREIARLWLPPASVIAFLAKTAQEKGISDEAAQWLHRVTVARTQEDGR